MRRCLSPDPARRRLLAVSALAGFARAAQSQERRDPELDQPASPRAAASAPTPAARAASRSGRVGARHFLLSGLPEPAGFGAYTYLLLGSAPSDAERPRHLHVLATLLRELPALADALQYVAPAGINLVMLPLRHLPQLPVRPEAASDDTLLGAAAALLSAYDHARAQGLLARLQVRPARSGPVLLTLLAPAVEAAAGEPVLMEDMSAAAPVVAGAWMRFALRSSSETRTWSAGALERTALNVRNLIAQVARSVPDIKSRSREWVTVARLER